MMIMMLAWRVRGGRAQGFKHGNLWTTPVGWRLVLLFPIFSANGSPQLALLYGESGFTVGTTQVGAQNTAEVHYYPDSQSPQKCDHVTCILSPDWMKSWSRDQTIRSPQKCCHSPRPADRKNALWVPFRGVTISNIPSVPFHQGKCRGRSLIPSSYCILDESPWWWINFLLNPLSRSLITNHVGNIPTSINGPH